MTPLTPEQLERVDALRNLDKVTLAVKLVRAQDALSVRPEGERTTWISVKDRLPEPSIDVLVRYYDGSMAVKMARSMSARRS